MSFLPIIVPQTFYLAESHADLQQVGTFLNELHQGFFRYRRPNGGSNEYYEAMLTMGTQTIGVRYVSPREQYGGPDRFVVTAFYDDTSWHQRVDFDQASAETKEEATARWILAARAALNVACVKARIPLLSIE